MYQTTQHKALSGVSDFSVQIAALKDVATGIKLIPLDERITIATAKKLVGLSLDAGRPMTGKAIEMSESISNMAVTEQIRMAANSVFDGIQRDIQPLLFDIIRPAEQAGQSTVPSAPFQAAVAKQIQAIVRGWETLAFLEEIKPLVLTLIDETIVMVHKIGEVFKNISKVVSEPFDNALDKLDNLVESTVDLTKWAVIGTGVFLLWYYGLRKK